MMLEPPTPGTVLPQKKIAITQALIDGYAQVSGDYNPLHVDPQAGAQAGFGGTIAHGCIPMEPVFQSLLAWSGADRLPRGTRMQLRYRAPSRPGDTITAHVTVQGLDAGQPVLRLAFECRNQRGDLALDGDCMWPL